METTSVFLIIALFQPKITFGNPNLELVAKGKMFTATERPVRFRLDVPSRGKVFEYLSVEGQPLGW